MNVTYRGKSDFLKDSKFNRIMDEIISVSGKKFEYKTKIKKSLIDEEPDYLQSSRIANNEGSGCNDFCELSKITNEIQPLLTIDNLSDFPEEDQKNFIDQKVEQINSEEFEFYPKNNKNLTGNNQIEENFINLPSTLEIGDVLDSSLLNPILEDDTNFTKYFEKGSAQIKESELVNSKDKHSEQQLARKTILIKADKSSLEAIDLQERKILGNWEKPFWTKAARYANDVYCDHPEKVQISKDIRVLVNEENSKVAWISFQGTLPAKNKVDNFDFKLIECPYALTQGSKCDKKYVEIFQKAEPAIQDFFKLRISMKTVVLIGFDSGGVYAFLTGLALRKKYQNPHVRVITFGQPPIGNLIFARWTLIFLPIYDRVTNQNDETIHIPLSRYHAGREIWLTPKQNYRCLAIDGVMSFSCSSTTRSNLKSDAHRGPYFGTLMGDCNPNRHKK
ncbi:hypothetical protein G9A89_020463 [Geosiphon pyriformis]|nr:hypothetical protein G9A89_020463 [Geosiphon pyriformis]